MTTKKDKSKLSKNEFIAYLASLSQEEINNLIKEKGKEPKLIEPIYFFEDNQSSN